MIVSQPIASPIDEPCVPPRMQGPVPLPDAQYTSAPDALVDGKDNERRLTADLRDAARHADPTRSLMESAIAFFWTAHPFTIPPAVFITSTVEKANAFADLAVTGRRSHEAYRRHIPTEAELVPKVKAGVGMSKEATDANVLTAVQAALTRAAHAERAIHGPIQGRKAARAHLGYIAVSGEDDQPDRPVNVPVTPFPQFDVHVTCKTFSGSLLTRRTRYSVASPTLGTSADESNPMIPDQDQVILFIHGHMSRLEESSDLVPWLHRVGQQRGISYAVVSLDLPNSGYFEMFDHTELAPLDASWYTNRYPGLDYIEEYIIQFVKTLDPRLHIKRRLAAVIGGSLGGNMGLRLGRRSEPWLRSITAWSPASVWASFADGHDFFKSESVRISRDHAKEPETHDSRRNYFHDAFDASHDIGPFEILPPQADMWWRDDWQPCKTIHKLESRMDRWEVYNWMFRQWHWRTGNEQLLYSHLSPEVGATAPRYLSNHKPTLLGSGDQDDYKFSNIYTATRDLAGRMVNTPGRTLFLLDTGHSIHNERPHLLAQQISDFALEQREHQGGWASCGKCAALFFLSGPSVCAAGGGHDGSRSAGYALVMDSIGDPGQHLWRWCNRCGSLYYSGATGRPSICAAGEAHDGHASADYSLAMNVAPNFLGERGWKWCSKCAGLFHSQVSANRCPAGQAHDGGSSADYALSSVPRQLKVWSDPRTVPLGKLATVTIFAEDATTHQRVQGKLHVRNFDSSGKPLDSEHSLNQPFSITLNAIRSGFDPQTFTFKQGEDPMAQVVGIYPYKEADIKLD